jgi:type VI secretion system protein ImpK
MNPNFAKAVDPVFLHVLGLLDRIKENRPISPDDERASIGKLLDDAQAKVGERQSWELAKYALVAWIDELLCAERWTGSRWWTDNLLEFSYFKTRERATEFFTKAKTAAEMTRRDALEVYYICVVLGFRGLYARSESMFMADQLRLPTDIQAWASQTVRSIQQSGGRPPIGEAMRPKSFAPPLNGKFLLVGTWLFTTILAVFTVIVSYALFWS